MSTPYTRPYDYTTDDAADIPINSTKVDADFDGIVTAINRKVLIQATEPSTPLTGQTWVDTSGTPPQFKIWDGSAWTAGVSLPAGAQGEVLYHNGSDWVVLSTGTVGQKLTSGGAAANVAWAGATVSRGTVSAADLANASITKDASFHDLDLSAIVPAGAVSVVLFVEVTDTSANTNFIFRQKGDTGTIQPTMRVQVANVYAMGQVEVTLDSDRVIQYNLNAASATANVTVLFWRF